MRARLLLPLLLCGTAALAQPFAYQDADNPSQAVGMMRSTLVAGRTMLAECTRRFPEYEDEMVGNLHAWEAREQAVILKARYAWWRTLREDPKLGRLSDFVRKSVAQKIRSLDDAPLEDAAKAQYIADYCRAHFADLASGVWRMRTPRAYGFMDEAPWPPPADEVDGEYGSFAALPPEQATAYVGTLTRYVQSHIVWKGDELPPQASCQVEASLAPDGQVLMRRVMAQDGPPAWCTAVLRAIDRADPMPRDPTGRVPRRLLLNFKGR
ncbi:cell envelope integrity TolA C-terminal domain-containing protein [Ottowia sp.]|uniref:cell envelope integrity TolA C-terminal domain-containing protein n=1 Tax=Ottowia sp. TaxID=1898956 RepID=UPI0039E69E0A